MPVGHLVIVECEYIVESKFLSDLLHYFWSPIIFTCVVANEKRKGPFQWGREETLLLSLYMLSSWTDGPLFRETWVGGSFKRKWRKHLFNCMATQIFYQVRADYAFIYDKRCSHEEKKKRQNKISLSSKITLCIITLQLCINLGLTPLFLTCLS